MSSAFCAFQSPRLIRIYSAKTLVAGHWFQQFPPDVHSFLVSQTANSNHQHELWIDDDDKESPLHPGAIEPDA